MREYEPETARTTCTARARRLDTHEAPVIERTPVHASEVELATWARAARAGDADAFGRLVVAHATELRRVLARYATPSDGPDDLVQEAFVRAWEALDRFDADRPFGPWVRRIGIRLALDRRRARAVRPEGSTIDDPASVERVRMAGQSSDRVEANELRALLESELDAMQPEWADVLRLRAIDDLSYAEISEVLEIPKGTVMSRLARARARLAHALAQRFGAPLRSRDQEGA